MENRLTKLRSFVRVAPFWLLEKTLQTLLGCVLGGIAGSIICLPLWLLGVRNSWIFFGIFYGMIFLSVMGLHGLWDGCGLVLSGSMILRMKNGKEPR